MAITSSLADDLLKSRSIHELRELVHTLQVDADGKKSELQSMVGGQYHEFVESADRIATMQQQSLEILDMLAMLENHTQESIKNVAIMLNGKNQKQEVPNGSAVVGHDEVNLQGKPYTLMYMLTRLTWMCDADPSHPASCTDINSTAVWKDLNKFDVFSAAAKALTAHELLHKASPSLLVPEAAAARDRVSMTPALRKSLKSVDFLSETVIHDAKLVLLCEGSDWSLQSKARALAAFRLLSGGSDIDALHLFTQCAEVEVKEILAKELAEDGGHEAGLLALVRKLQAMTVELFLLFCKPLALTANHNGHGLVHYYMHQLVVEVNSRFVKCDGLQVVPSPEGDAQLKEVSKEVKAFLNGLFAHITEQCHVLLQSISNALQVATLQQLIYNSSISLTFGAPIAKQQLTVGTLCIEYSQALYVEACYELLSNKVVKHKREISGRDGQHALQANLIYSEAHTLLWNKVFYVLFLNIVETLLCKACEDILANAVALLLGIFKDMGISMTAQGSVQSIANAQCLSSSQIYRKAEYVCSYFDHAVAKLLEDVIKPVHRGDQEEGNATALSLASLNKALRLYCSKLCGQFLCTIRNVVHHLQAALYSYYASAPITPAGSQKKKNIFQPALVPTRLKEMIRLCDRPGLEALTMSYFAQLEQIDGGQLLLVSGLLLMGRLTWSMKYRCNSLYTALQKQASNGNMVSMEQLRSAFEIADTNGDGVLEHDEAVEALQALSLGEENHSALNRITSLSFPEFLLVFGTDAVSQDSNLLSAMEDSLDHLTSMCHVIYAVHTIQTASGSLGKELLVDLGMETGVFCKYKSTWITQTVEGDSMPIPSQCSAALYMLLYSTCKDVNHCMVSMDSLAAYYNHHAHHGIDATNEEDFNSMQLLAYHFYPKQQAANTVVLVQCVYQMVYQLLLEHIYVEYRSSVDQIVRKQAAAGDEVFMQLMVDLQVCKHLCQRLHAVDRQADFQSMLDEVSAQIDPVLQELVNQPLEAMAKSIITRMHLLLFPYAYTGMPGSSASTNGIAVATNMNTPAANIVSTLFASSTSNMRFGLLPLALLTNTSSGKITSTSSVAERGIEWVAGGAGAGIPRSTTPSPVNSTASNARGGIMGWFSNR